MVSGGFTPEEIRRFVDRGAPVDFFGIGTYIACSPSNPVTSDIHEADGRAVAKGGRIPGVTPNPRLDRVM
jgi:nicotinate phosphoribosyltransferase